MIEMFMISCGLVSLLFLGGIVIAGYPEIAMLFAHLILMLYFANVIRQNKEAYLAKMFVICLALVSLPLFIKHAAMPLATTIVPLENTDIHTDFTKIIQIFIYFIDIIGIGFILYYGYLFIKSLSHKKKINLAKILSENGFIPMSIGG